MLDGGYFDRRDDFYRVLYTHINLYCRIICCVMMWYSQIEKNNNNNKKFLSGDWTCLQIVQRASKISRFRTYKKHLSDTYSSYSIYGI